MLNAAVVLIISQTEKIIAPENSADEKSPFKNSDRYDAPTKRINNSPTKNDINKNVFVFLFSITYPTKYAANGNDNKYPPVGPNSLANPKLNPAKTGNPIEPKTKYIIWLYAPFFEPKKAPANNTNMVLK